MNLSFCVVCASLFVTTRSFMGCSMSYFWFLVLILILFGDACHETQKLGKLSALAPARWTHGSNRNPEPLSSGPFPFLVFLCQKRHVPSAAEGVLRGQDRCVAYHRQQYRVGLGWYLRMWVAHTTSQKRPRAHVVVVGYCDGSTDVSHRILQSWRH